jgi:hypothetical protein
MIIKNKTFITAIGIIDIIAGTGFIILPRLFPLFIAGYRDHPFLSEAMLISLALPFLVVITGVGIMLKKDWARIFGFFVAFIAVIYAATEFFSAKPRAELINTEAGIRIIFSVVLPLITIVYAVLHTLLLLMFTKQETAFWGASQKQDEAVERTFREAEHYCARCTKSVSPDDEICKECGALLKGLRCKKCKYEAAASTFTQGRCPRCGSEVEKV